MKSIRKIRINRRTAYGLGGFTLLVLISFAGVVGFQTWQTYSSRAQTLSKAEAFYKEASDPTKVTKISDLTNAIEKLKQAGVLLQGIPASAGSFHQTAQTDLEKVRSQIGALEQRIKVEEEAETTQAEANRSAQEAINTFKNSVKLAEWKTASNSLREAISQLESIPQDAFITKQVKANLANYQSQANVMAKAIGTENNAVQLLDSVDAVAQQAMDITASRSEYTLADLQSAQATWQRAIKLLKTIPAKSVAAAGIESRRSIYVENSSKIAAGIKELQQCLKTSSLKDMCGYISLSLSNPPTNRFSTTSRSDSDSTSDYDPFEQSSF
jgi:tetratricopeptide (TPR) repeat protein